MPEDTEVEETPHGGLRLQLTVTEDPPARVKPPRRSEEEPVADNQGPEKGAERESLVARLQRLAKRQPAVSDDEPTQPELATEHEAETETEHEAEPPVPVSEADPEPQAADPEPATVPEKQAPTGFRILAYRQGPGDDGTPIMPGVQVIQPPHTEEPVPEEPVADEAETEEPEAEEAETKEPEPAPASVPSPEVQAEPEPEPAPDAPAAEPAPEAEIEPTTAPSAEPAAEASGSASQEQAGAEEEPSGGLLSKLKGLFTRSKDEAGDGPDLVALAGADQALGAPPPTPPTQADASEEAEEASTGGFLSRFRRSKHAKEQQEAPATPPIPTGREQALNAPVPAPPVAEATAPRIENLVAPLPQPAPEPEPEATEPDPEPAPTEQPLAPQASDPQEIETMDDAQDDEPEQETGGLFGRLKRKVTGGDGDPETPAQAPNHADEQEPAPAEDDATAGPPPEPQSRAEPGETPQIAEPDPEPEPEEVDLPDRKQLPYDDIVQRVEKVLARKEEPPRKLKVSSPRERS